MMHILVRINLSVLFTGQCVDVVCVMRRAWLEAGQFLVIQYTDFAVRNDMHESCCCGVTREIAIRRPSMLFDAEFVKHVNLYLNIPGLQRR